MNSLKSEVMLKSGDARHVRYIIVSAALLLSLIALSTINICMGSANISVNDVLSAIFGGNVNTDGYDIIMQIRLPRIIAAILLGGALALSGFLLQTFFNNPIAGPYVLGISSGARLVIAVLMILLVSRGVPMNSTMMILAAFAGAMMSMGFVLLIARKVRRSSALILSGVMIGYICSAITDFLVTFANDENIVGLHNWSMGSFSGISWDDIQVISIVVFIGSGLVFLLSKPMAAYQLGEEYAQSVGVNVKAFRIALVLLSSILCGCVTAFAGPISFVGIAVPHLIKASAKTAKPVVVIPLCFLGGAVFCLCCDLVARTAFAPIDMNISSVSSLFGAPVVIYIMARKAVRS